MVQGFKYVTLEGSEVQEQSLDALLEGASFTAQFSDEMKAAVTTLELYTP